jgi:large subunit ribosomal protein L35
MPKMKTKSGAKKRFRATATGKVKSKRAWTQHRLISKPQTAKVRNRGTDALVKQDGETVLKFWMPYARKKLKKGRRKYARALEAANSNSKES